MHHPDRQLLRTSSNLSFSVFISVGVRLVFLLAAAVAVHCPLFGILSILPKQPTAPTTVRMLL